MSYISKKGYSKPADPYPFRFDRPTIGGRDIGEFLALLVIILFFSVAMATLTIGKNVSQSGQSGQIESPEAQSLHLTP